MQNLYKGQRGLNLIELITVIAIVSIITTWAVGTFKYTSSSAELRTTTNDLIRVLRHAGDKARNQARPIVVNFEQNGQLTIVQVIDEADADNILRELRITGDISLPDDAGGKELSSFRFSPEGTVNLGLPASFDICDSDRSLATGRTVTLLASGMVNLSGRIQCKGA